jgi:site-specific recombinase XerD
VVFHASLQEDAVRPHVHVPARRMFPNVHGARLSADSIQSLLAKHVQVASERCPSLKSKRVSPHVLRHSSAMERKRSFAPTFNGRS